MNGHDFLRISNDAFAPFLSELGFQPDTPSISGRHYRATFSSPTHTVSVSFEPGDDVFQVLVFSRIEGRPSRIDEPRVTPRLSDLNARYMSMVNDAERAKRTRALEHVAANDDDERTLLKFATELSLVLPHYLSTPRPIASRLSSGGSDEHG